MPRSYPLFPQNLGVTSSPNNTLQFDPSATIASGQAGLASVQSLNFLDGLCGVYNGANVEGTTSDGFLTGTQGAANSLCGLFGGGNYTGSGDAIGTAQSAIGTGSTMISGDPTTITSGSGLIGGFQGVMDNMCGLFTGSPSTGTNAQTIYDGTSSTIATGSTMLTGDPTMVTSGTGLIGGGINLSNLLCGLCGGGTRLLGDDVSPEARQWASEHTARLGYPTPEVSGASLLGGVRSWMGVGSSHLTGDPNAITSGVGLASAAQGHLDGVASLVGLGGSGNSVTTVVSQGTQYHADALAIAGNPTGLGTGTPVVNTSANNIPLLAPANANHQDLIDNLHGGLTGTTSSGNSAAAVANAASVVAANSYTAISQSQKGSTYVDMMAVNSPGYHAVDPSLAGVFNITTMTGSAPDTITVSATSSAIGFIHIAAAAIKQSVVWIGGGVDGLSAAYVNLYTVNTTTGALTPVWRSANIISHIGSWTTPPPWIYITMPALTVNQGEWIAAELAVVGSGLTTMVGMPSHWLGANGNVYPKQLAATRDSQSAFVDTEFTYGGTGLISSGSWSHTVSPAATAIYTILNVVTTGATVSPTAAVGGTAMTLERSYAYDTQYTAPLYDATGAGYTRITTATGASGSWSHTATAGAAVIVAVATYSAAAASSFTRTATYAGASMSSLGVVNTQNSTQGWVELFGIIGVSGGAQTVAISITGGTINDVAASSVSYTGVASFGTAVTSYGSSTAATSTGVTATTIDIVVQAFNATNTGSVVTNSAYSGTSRYAQNLTGAAGHLSMTLGDAPGTTTVTVTETLSTSSYFGSVAVRLLGNASIQRGYLALFSLYSPPTGAQTVSFALGASAYVSGASVSYVGPASSGTVVATNGTGTSQSQTLTLGADQVVLQAFANDTGNGTISSYNEEIISYHAGSVGHYQPLLVGEALGTGSAGTFTATSGVSAPWGALALPLVCPSYVAAPAVISSPIYSPNVPWLALSSETVTTTGTYAPVTTPFTTAGTFTFLIPFWASFINLITIGGGGGPEAGGWFYTGKGGGAGHWGGKILERAIDFKDDPAATLTVVVGAGGVGTVAGGSTTVTWTDPSNVTHTLTVTGGTAGTFTNGAGQPAGNYIFDGTPYYGGGAGASPGGGGNGDGGGGTPGGAGGAWVLCRGGAGQAANVPLNSSTTGTGRLVPKALRSIPFFLAGQGLLSPNAIVGYPARVHGQGVLHAVLKPKVTTAPTAHGALSAPVGAQIPAVTSTGHGALAVTFKPKRPVAAGLPGNGNLLALWHFGKLAAMSGRGTLSVGAVTTNVFRSAASVGSGTLSAKVSVVVLDTFHRANSPDLGPNWTTAPYEVNFALYNNMAVTTTTGEATNYWGTSMTADDAYVAVTVAQAGSVFAGVKLMLRANLSGYNLRLDWSGNYVHLTSSVLGQITFWGGQPTYAVGDTIFFQAIGNVYSFGRNGTTLGSYTDTGYAGYPYSGASYRMVGMGYDDSYGSPTAGLGFSAFIAHGL